MLDMFSKEEVNTIVDGVLTYAFNHIDLCEYVNDRCFLITENGVTLGLTRDILGYTLHITDEDKKTYCLPHADIDIHKDFEKLILQLKNTQDARVMQQKLDEKAEIVSILDSFLT